MEYSAPLVATCSFNPQFLVYSDGSLYDAHREEFKSFSGNGKKSPYKSYMIRHPIKGKKGKKHYVHRLVATHFLDNPNNLRDVHHIDSNPHNNDISNLQWLSHQDNCRLKPKIHPIYWIKKRQNAYVTKMDKSDRYIFSYFGSYNNIPIHKRSFKTKEGAIEYRDMFFGKYPIV